MRLAIVSDIHGNLEALDAVLAHVDGEAPDALACLGDFVGYGATPNECIERLRPRLGAAVLGNHDAAALGRLKLGSFNTDAASAARWTETSLTGESRAYLEALPMSVVWNGARLVHASPIHPEGWNYVLSLADAEEEMQAFGEALCFIGHSHYPGLFERDAAGAMRYTRAADVELAAGRRYLVNVPSVGQPRDGDPRAGYLLWDGEARSVRHVRLEYNVGGAMKRILDAGLPRFLADRLQWGE
jgi:diadenosine tetraphosphatase ApaH/serine/threonine PP2A family protein phosphatase